jgi:hypothetical protein
MPLRRKPVSRLRHWSGGTPSQSRADERPNLRLLGIAARCLVIFDEENDTHSQHPNDPDTL